MAYIGAHTVKSFDDELHQLRSLVTQMGGLCEAQITTAIDSLMRRNPEAAQIVIETDTRIDAPEDRRHRVRSLNTSTAR